MAAGYFPNKLRRIRNNADRTWRNLQPVSSVLKNPKTLKKDIPQESRSRPTPDKPSLCY